MNIENIDRRIVQLSEQIHQQLPAEQPIKLKMHLFTLAGQSRITALLSLLDYNLNNLNQLTGEQRDQLHNWLLLEQALDQEDREAAAQYRRRLAMPLEQLLAAFLAIDENTLPEFEQAPTYIDQLGIRYTLHRTQFRSTKAMIERAIQCNRLHACDVEDMRMWVEAFA